MLRKLRQFQELGHIAVLILGDFTARVGDPSGRSATRPPLSRRRSTSTPTYVEQVERILDCPTALEVRRNSEWLAGMGIADVLRLAPGRPSPACSSATTSPTRYRRRPISVSEFLYPLLQGWDSVVVRADVELGGTDQLFNNLMGRTLQEQEGQEPQVVITMPLLEGLDGVQKMSKSLGNYIGITEPPGEQFGKVMSIPDALMPRYRAHDRLGPRPGRRRHGGVSARATSRRSTRSGSWPARSSACTTTMGRAEEAEAEFDRSSATTRPRRTSPSTASTGRRCRTVRCVSTGCCTTRGWRARTGRPAGSSRAAGCASTASGSRPELAVPLDGLGDALLQVGRKKWVRIRVG